MNSAYEGTAMETRMDTMATATIRFNQRHAAAGGSRSVCRRRLQAAYMSVSLTHLRGAIHRNSPGVLCSNRCPGGFSMPRGGSMDGRADRPRGTNTRERQPHLCVNCAVLLPSECDGVPLRGVGAGRRSRLARAVARRHVSADMLCVSGICSVTPAPARATCDRRATARRNPSCPAPGAGRPRSIAAAAHSAPQA